MGKTVFVLGASGLVGRALLVELEACAEVQRVVALGRRAEAAKGKVYWQKLDFNNIEKSWGNLHGDVLFSALGTTIKKAGSLQRQRQVDLEYQYKVAEVARHSGVTDYHLVSSYGASSSSKNSYLQMKGELEERVQNLAYRGNFIYRPSLLLGNRPEFRLAEFMGGALLPLLCWLPPLAVYRPIHAQQLAKTMVAMLAAGKSGSHIVDGRELFR